MGHPLAVGEQIVGVGGQDLREGTSLLEGGQREPTHHQLDLTYRLVPEEIEGGAVQRRASLGGETIRWIELEPVAASPDRGEPLGARWIGLELLAQPRDSVVDGPAP